MVTITDFRGYFWKKKSLYVCEGIEKLLKLPNTSKKKFRSTSPNFLKTKVKKIKLVKLGRVFENLYGFQWDHKCFL